MAQIISVIQQKGGVGKTTISINIAFELARRYPHLKVAIADADKQQSALRWVAKDSIIKVIAVNEDGEGATLKDELNNIEADFIILDCPGVLGAITLRAAMYADVILVPVGQGINNLRATQAALNICNEAKDFDPGKEILLVPSNIKNTTSAGKRIRSDIEPMGREYRRSQ